MFGQNITKSGYFANKNQALSFGDYGTNGKYSNLNRLGTFEAPNGMYHAQMVYPETGMYNEWTQTSNLVDSTSVDEYQPIHLDFEETGT